MLTYGKNSSEVGIQMIAKHGGNNAGCIISMLQSKFASRYTCAEVSTLWSTESMTFAPATLIQR